MPITKLQPFNLDVTANYTFGNVTATNFVGNGSQLTGIATGVTTQSITGYYPGTNTAQAGTLRRYFAGNTAITKITAWVSTVSTSDMVIGLKKNGINTGNVTVTANSYTGSATIAANLVANTDYITLDIVSGSGTDIGVRLDYTSS